MGLVAPYVGAWIETLYEDVYNVDSSSHPTWVRGLKQSVIKSVIFDAMSHPTWVRGLKHRLAPTVYRVNMSHPTWVRGLKPVGRGIPDAR